jgi:endonuclease III
VRNASAYGRKLQSLLRRLEKQYEPEPPEELGPTNRMVRAFCEWNTTTKRASNAYDRLMNRVVDLNELRVTPPEELVAVFGTTYPQAKERVERMLELLQALFQTRRGTSLDFLLEMPKKEARAYLQALPGMVPYVEASVSHLALGAHAVPTDEMLAKALRDEEAVDPRASVSEIAGFLERQIRAEDAGWACGLLRAFADNRAPRSAQRSRGRRGAKAAAGRSGSGPA